MGSISTLNGRTKIWRDGLSAFSGKPILGHGFTAGGEAFTPGNGKISTATAVSADQDSFFSMDKSREIGKATLHNGVIQSLLDAGIVGTFFYIGAMVAAIRAFINRDRKKEYPAEFSCLVFLLITNIAQNVIYSAAVFDSIMFWGLAAFALSLDSLDPVRADLSIKRYFGQFHRGVSVTRP
jgi:O-antigen ligase